YPATLSYEISKQGLPVKDLVPYLGAPMHVSVVKSDLSAFVHTHGEVHKPGDPIPPIVVKDVKIVHSMASMYMPAQFGPMVETHVLFPSPGDYTVFGQFKEGERVVVTKFTVRVD
ncbi:MAG: hypothetical protein K2X74_00380, partial [Acetobacteraceae bacterium]|nr:hypothetical protein [Acetobacteraceae bacterium]